MKASRAQMKIMKQLGELRVTLDAQKVRLVQSEQNMEQILKGLGVIQNLVEAQSMGQDAAKPAETSPVKPRRRGRTSKGGAA